MDSNHDATVSVVPLSHSIVSSNSNGNDEVVKEYLRKSNILDSNIDQHHVENEISVNVQDLKEILR